VIDLVSLNEFDLPKKFNNYTFLFSKVPMKWNQEYQSFVSTEEKLPLASMGGDMVNRMLTCYIEARMPFDDDDRLYIYLKSPSRNYYFFGFRQGIMNVVSNSDEFNEIVASLKSKQRIVKMDDGNTYEIQLVEKSTASTFLARAQEAQK